MEGIIIKQIKESSPEFFAVWELREEILRKPLGLSLRNEDLSDDKQDAIFIALHDNRVIGCVMMHPVDGATIKLRQMAVYNEWQGKGIGKMLVQAAEEYSWDTGYKKIKLHARQHAVGFYALSGYNICSEEFIEVSIPHLAMEKNSPQ